MYRSFMSFVVFGILVPAAQISVHAQECWNENLRGEYVLLAGGAVTIPNTPITGPFRRVSRGVFDGVGNVKVTSVASYNGLVFNEPFDGTYSVAPDCTVTMKVNVPAPLNFPVTFKGLLSDGFRELDLTAVDPPGSALLARLRRQDIRGCTVRDLVGSFRLELSGQVLGPPGRPGEFVRLGRFVADGAGRFTANTNVSYHGLFAEESLTGTYEVDSECRLTIRHDAAGASGNIRVTLFGGLIDGGEAAFLIQVNPQGAVVGGSLTLIPRR